jgi:hypothetical protein
VVDGAAVLGGVVATGTDADGTVLVVAVFELLLQLAATRTIAQTAAKDAAATKPRASGLR